MLPLGGVERRKEGIGRPGERGRRPALHVPAAVGQVDQEGPAVLRVADPYHQRVFFQFVEQVHHRGAVDGHRGGHVSSLAGHTSFPYTEAYAAAKDGLTAFSRVLAGDYRGTGISATSLVLGPVKDAGITTRTLAETGLTASTAFSVPPEKVAAAVLRAIRKPTAEIVVSVGPGRFLKALMDYFPGLGPAINRLSGATKLMASVADYREAQRTRPVPDTRTP